MDAFASIANLALAAADQSVVADVIGAIRAADAAEAKDNAPLSAMSSRPAAVYEPRVHIHRDPCYAPRQIIHPEPRYADRQIIHPEPRIGNTRPALEPWPECEKVHGPVSKSPIQPPWAVLPWTESPRPTIRVKVIVHRTDIVSKGTLIDTFV